MKLVDCLIFLEYESHMVEVYLLLFIVVSSERLLVFVVVEILLYNYLL